MTTSVSVVIPTTGRAELAHAVESVRSQSSASSIALIVVADLSQDDPRAANVTRVSETSEVVYTGGGLGAGYARNLGSKLATGDYIAYLDDDDRWHPRKIETQLHALSETGATVSSCRVRQVDATTREVLAPSVPLSLISSSARPADYLFRQRRPRAGRASIFTSTLLVESGLASRVEWDPSLRRHQDWDWLIRLHADADWSIAPCPEVLVDVAVGSSNSISRTSDWESSLAWASRSLAAEAAQTRVDFLAGQTLRYALQARSPRGVAKVCSAIASERRLPSLGPAVLGLAGLGGSALVRRALRSTR